MHVQLDVCTHVLYACGCVCTRAQWLSPGRRWIPAEEIPVKVTKPKTPLYPLAYFLYLSWCIPAVLKLGGRLPWGGGGGHRAAVGGQGLTRGRILSETKMNEYLCGENKQIRISRCYHAKPLFHKNSTWIFFLISIIITD